MERQEKGKDIRETREGRKEKRREARKEKFRIAEK